MNGTLLTKHPRVYPGRLFDKIDSMVGNRDVRHGTAWPPSGRVMCGYARRTGWEAPRALGPTTDYYALCPDHPTSNTWW